jgi:hypothetical protein
MTYIFINKKIKIYLLIFSIIYTILTTTTATTSSTFGPYFTIMSLFEQQEKTRGLRQLPNAPISPHELHVLLEVALRLKVIDPALSFFRMVFAAYIQNDGTLKLLRLALAFSTSIDATTDLAIKAELVEKAMMLAEMLGFSVEVLDAMIREREKEMMPAPHELTWKGQLMRVLLEIRGKTK